MFQLNPSGPNTIPKMYCMRKIMPKPLLKYQKSSKALDFPDLPPNPDSLQSFELFVFQ